MGIVFRYKPFNERKVFDVSLTLMIHCLWWQLKKSCSLLFVKQIFTDKYNPTEYLGSLLI